MKELIGYIIGFVMSIIVIPILISLSNKYEDEINELKLENKKLIYNNKELKNSVEILQNSCDSVCNCSWYEDFYYEHAEEVGVFE